MKGFILKSDWTTIKNLFLVAFIFVLFFSCTSSTNTAKVKMKVDSQTAHVNLGSDVVKVGDTVKLYKNECEAFRGIIDSSQGDTVHCDVEYLGSGVVSRLFNNEYSEIKTDGSFEITKGIFVKKEEVYSE